jgi:hypothetical protein
MKTATTDRPAAPAVYPALEDRIDVCHVCGEVASNDDAVWVVDKWTCRECLPTLADTPRKGVAPKAKATR